jgi:hypothetical protein
MWVDRLFRRLTSVWSQDPQKVLAMSINCDGTDLSWTVADGVLTITPVGGTAAPYSAQLSSFSTINNLARTLRGLPGMYIGHLCVAPYRLLSPQCLIEGSGDIGTMTNGNYLYLATSPQYLMLQAVGGVLGDAAAQIPNMPLQMSTTTASGSWLDYLGGYFNVARANLEGDAAYAIRIIQETIMPKCNNLSIARAIQQYTGYSCQVTTVTTYDGTPYYFDGTWSFDGSHTYGSGIIAVNGGLFDVEAGFDIIEGSELTDITTLLTGLINRLRAAGTGLRNLVIAPLSNLQDPAPVPNDSSDTLAITYGYTFDGSFSYDGTVIYSGGLTVTGPISGS